MLETCAVTGWLCEDCLTAVCNNGCKYGQTSCKAVDMEGGVYLHLQRQSVKNRGKYRQKYKPLYIAVIA